MVAPAPSYNDLTAPRFESLLDVIRLRRSVRSFEPPPEPLPADAVRGICEAGRWAPSGANTQPWHFVVAAERTDVIVVSDVFVRQADRLVEHCRGFPHVHKKHWLHNSLAIVLIFCDPRWVDSYPVSDHPGWSEEYDANNEKILLASVGAARPEHAPGRCRVRTHHGVAERRRRGHHRSGTARSARRAGATRADRDYSHRLAAPARRIALPPPTRRTHPLGTLGPRPNAGRRCGADLRGAVRRQAMYRGSETLEDLDE